MKIGWGRKEITPPEPAALAGQFYDRIARETRDPLMATALALEGADGEQAVLVSCDLIAIEKHVQIGVRERVRQIVPELDPSAILLNATHTHTAPYTYSESLWIPLFWTRQPPEAMTPETYASFAIGRIAEAVAEAWTSRSAGAISRGEGHAALGYNRRVLYDDGTASMYGKLDATHFYGFEGPEDHRVDMLFTWDRSGELTGVVVNAACPAQINEGDRRVSADYFGEVRLLIRDRWQRDVHVLGIIGAAGDQAPFDLIRRRYSQLSVDDELRSAARKLVGTMEDAFEQARLGREDAPVFRHKIREVELPLRMVPKVEAEYALEEWEKFCKRCESEEEPSAYFQSLGFERQNELLQAWSVQNRYKQLQRMKFFRFEMHTLRIGEATLVTNPFELFTGYGLQLRARSAAKMTLVSQLTCDSGGYLPTAEAVVSGGYSTQLFNGLVGPEGGRLLVEYTLQSIQELWDRPEGDGQ